MKALCRNALLGIFAAGSIAVASSAASAAIVCNEDGDCWHVKDKYDYKPEFKLNVYPDDWKWKDADSHKYRWREHDGRGYWHSGIWLQF